MTSEHLYIVTYDIADAKRWRALFRVMNGHGAWLQLSVFQCRLTTRRRAELAMKIEAVIDRRADHVLILDLGPADRVEPRVESLGKRFAAARREAIVV